MGILVNNEDLTHFLIRVAEEQQHLSTITVQMAVMINELMQRVADLEKISTVVLDKK